MKTTKTKLAEEKRKITLQTQSGSAFVLSYTLKRSNRRKNYTLFSDSYGRIELRVPYYATEASIQCVLKKHADWIAGKTAKGKENASRTSLSPSNPPLPSNKEQEETLRLEATKKLSPLLKEKIAYYEPQLPKGHIPIRRISIRNQKTCWGSCSSRGTLSFNWRLALIPETCLDYVVVHELCHLCEFNHSPAFWKLVESLYPSWREARTWLKENGRLYFDSPFSSEDGSAE